MIDLERSHYLSPDIEDDSERPPSFGDILIDQHVVRKRAPAAKSDAIPRLYATMSTPHAHCVFISSTFRDPPRRKEHEHLIKQIFPEMIGPSAWVGRFVVSAGSASPWSICAWD